MRRFFKVVYRSLSLPSHDRNHLLTSVYESRSLLAKAPSLTDRIVANTLYLKAWINSARKRGGTVAVGKTPRVQNPRGKPEKEELAKLVLEL